MSSRRTSFSQSVFMLELIFEVQQTNVLHRKTKSCLFVSEEFFAGETIEATKLSGLPQQDSQGWMTSGVSKNSFAQWKPSCASSAFSISPMIRSRCIAWVHPVKVISCMQPNLPKTVPLPGVFWPRKSANPKNVFYRSTKPGENAVLKT